VRDGSNKHRLDGGDLSAIGVIILTVVSGLAAKLLLWVSDYETTALAFEIFICLLIIFKLTEDKD